MELLRDLVLERHERRPAGSGEPEPPEDLRGIVQLRPVGLVRIPYLVMADLERDRAPRLPEIGEPDVEGHHDVLLPHVPRMRRLPRDDAPREALPAARERLPERLRVGGRLAGGGGVEVGREPRLRVAVAHLDGAAALHHPVGQHLGDDRVRHERPEPHVGALVPAAFPADRVVEMPHAVGPLHRHRSSPSRASCSAFVMNPPLSAAFAASRALSKPILGTAARMASDARWQRTPS